MLSKAFPMHLSPKDYPNHLRFRDLLLGAEEIVQWIKVLVLFVPGPGLIPRTSWSLKPLHM